MAARPKIYVKTPSVVLGAPEGAGGGGELVWCASYDGAEDAPADGLVEWQVFKVIDFEASRAGLVPVRGIVAAYGLVVLRPSFSRKWNRGELGFGFPESPASPTPLPEQILGQPLVPGLYCLQATNPSAETAAEASSYAYFVVRRRTARTTVLLCYPFSASLVRASFAPRAPASRLGSGEHRIARDRPLLRDVEACLHLGLRAERMFDACLPLLRGGPELDVCTSFDLHAEDRILDGIRLFVGAGHDEFWTTEMRARLDHFLRDPHHAAFFSVDARWMRTRFDDDDRTLVLHEDDLVRRAS